MQRATLNLPLVRKFLGFNAKALSASLIAALLGFLLLSMFFAQQHLRSETLWQADTLAANLATPLVDKDINAAQNQILNTGNRPGLTSIKVFDKQGRHFAGWDSLSQFNGTPGAELVPGNNAVHTSWGLSQLSVAAPILLDEEIVGKLQLQVSTAPVYKELLWLFLLGLLLIAAILAIAAYALTRWQVEALQPVHELCNVSEQVVGLNDYNLRIWNDGRHEFTALIQHVNQMLARINVWESSEETIIRLQREEEQKVDILDNHDSLTRLPNRHYFHRVLVHSIDESIETGELAALMFIDLDDFKLINDGYGYEAGDMVLSTIALRLSTTLRGTDTLCRIGGDEFAAILPQVGSIALAESLANRILAIIRQPITLYGKNVVVNASIGLACSPLHAQEQKQLLRNGDIALAAAKAGGKNSYRTYTVEAGLKV
ncbi:sensor domain-containing diguanylate cyclase [Undibacterium terreum]|uniref:Diguanylate cyclase n=1 Tax=Undibacterium terreum TaxID=1224302 RepID=A0A916XP15_9BURK|nr:sensor domain-containing diguanylate cyclase [Undibacterium terreum]GGC88119.1 diguanylate cyclase [Undibacterium terreum]